VKKSILFVCLGNICRSPGAEAIFNSIIRDEHLNDEIICDSAGTIGAHAGEPADPRMLEHASRRGYNVTSIARKFNPREDFDKFDYIIAMDDSIESDLQRLTRNADDSEKIYRMTDFSSSSKYSGVPDPYYSGSSGFEVVLDLLEDACEGLLEHIRNEI
jgi:protein-tyrosine phosphatase